MKRPRSEEAKAFGALLARRREEAGFRGPRAFFEAAGGRAALGCSLKAYTDAERGRAVPSPALAERIAAGLRLALEADAGEEFARCYLRALLGGNAFLEFAAWALRRDGPARRRRAAAVAVPPAVGETVLDHPFLLRASEAELLDYAPYLERALGDAAARPAPAPQAEDHVLEVRITRLLPF